MPNKQKALYRHILNGEPLSKEELLQRYDGLDYTVTSLTDREIFEDRIHEDGKIELFNTEYYNFLQCYGGELELVEKL